LYVPFHEALEPCGHVTTLLELNLGRNVGAVDVRKKNWLAPVFQWSDTDEPAVTANWDILKSWAAGGLVAQDRAGTARRAAGSRGRTRHVAINLLSTGSLLCRTPGPASWAWRFTLHRTDPRCFLEDGRLASPDRNLDPTQKSIKLHRASTITRGTAREEVRVGGIDPSIVAG
jgi:hypothetical protein